MTPFTPSNTVIRKLFCVIKLTILSSVIAGCSLFQDRYGETCKTRAYIREDVEAYIKTRFPSHSPIRVAIIPFSTPANIAAFDNERPGLGNEIAWRLHGEFLKSQIFPMIEVFNRQDWPGKKEEFFTGNFGSLQFARDAGYDLALIGFVDSPKDLYELPVLTKLIDTESGVTLWYGKSVVSSRRPELDRMSDAWWMGKRKPALLHTDSLVDEAAKCIVDQIRLESER